MKKLVAALGLAVVSISNFAAQAKGPNIEEIAKRSCKAKIEAVEAQMVPLKIKIEQIHRMNDEATASFVIPAVTQAVRTFTSNVDSVNALISTETRELMAESNEAYHALKRSNYNYTINEAIRNDLARRYSLPIVEAIKRDLKSLGEGRRNGNRVEFQDNKASFQVVYMPYADIPAGSIVFQSYLENRSLIGGDVNKLVTVRLEFVRNSATNSVTGLPKSLNSADILNLFKTSDASKASLFFLSQEQEKNADTELANLEKDQGYIECKALFN